MNWEIVGTISELMAAIAVIITLGYVAVQIRQNTSALRSAATQGAHDQTASMYDLLASDAELNDIFVRGLEEPETLGRVETGRFYALLLGVMFRIQNWYLQAEAQALDHEQFAGWCRVLRQISGMPGFLAFWESRKHLFTPSFVKYLEREVFLSERDPGYRPLGVSHGDHAQ